MSYTLLQQILATDPRKLAQFPEAPLDRALADWRRLSAATPPPAPAPAPATTPVAPEAKAAPNSAPAPTPSAATAPASASPSPSASAPSAPAASVAPVEASVTPDLGPTYADLATHVWRARNRLGAAPPEVARRTLRHLDAATETLRELAVTSKDWLNEPYDPGLPLKVISFQPTEGLARDTIIEIVRPAVFWRQRLVQSGEVVVGRPLEAP